MCDRVTKWMAGITTGNDRSKQKLGILLCTKLSTTNDSVAAFEQILPLSMLKSTTNQMFRCKFGVT